jgi:hypothetical protein
MSSSLKSPPSSALTDIHVDPSDCPVRPSRTCPTATMLHPASCPPAYLHALLDALCLHDPVTTRSRLLRALYARCRMPLHAPSPLQTCAHSVDSFTITSNLAHSSEKPLLPINKSTIDFPWSTLFSDDEQIIIKLIQCTRFLQPFVYA